MDCRKYGSKRDDRILDAITTTYKVLTAKQVHQLFFAKQSQGLRIASRRLKAMYDRQELVRRRHQETLEFMYYVNSELNIAQIEHRLGVNGMYVDKVSKLDQWEKVYVFNSEVDFKILRADGLFGVQNTVNTNAPIKFYFLEYDKSNNPFNKIELYNQLFERQMDIDLWFSKYTNKFPEILIRTHRKQAVERLIEKQNKHNLRFNII